MRNDDGNIPYMERVGEVVHKWIAATGMSAAEVSRRAGVSSSTLHRILHDRVDPSIGTITEVALACGVDASLVAARPCDPHAAAAARSMLESSYTAPDSAEVARWVDRLPRLANGGDPVSLVAAAAAYSSPLDQPCAVLFDGTMTLGRIASAGAASGRLWAVSGAAALYLPAHTEPAPAVTILWCEDAHAVAQLLTDSPLVRTARPDHASIAVVTGEPELFHGSFVEGIVTYAAPIQIIIDCLSLKGKVAEDARREAQTW